MKLLFRPNCWIYQSPWDNFVPRTTTFNLTHIFKVIQPCLCNKTAQIWHILRSMAHTILDGSFPYLKHMITSMRVCVVGNNLLPWPTTFKSFVHDFSIKILKYGTQWPLTWLYIQSYLAVTLPIVWIWFICGTNTTHKRRFVTISRSTGQVSRWHGLFWYCGRIWRYPTRSTINDLYYHITYIHHFWWKYTIQYNQERYIYIVLLDFSGTGSPI